MTATPSTTTAANFLANITAYEAGYKAGTQGAITLSDGSAPVLSTTAANFLANIDAFGLLASTHSVSLTDGGTPNLVLSAAQESGNNLTELAKITPPFTFAMSGPVLAGVANSLVGFGLQSKLSAPINVRDSASTLYGAFSSLQTLFNAGLLGTITLTDANFSVTQISISTATQSAYSGVLSKIVSPYALALVVTAAQAASTTIPQGGFQYLAVQDTTANILANLSALETLAPSGKITYISASDPQAVTLSAAQAAANWDALGYFYNASSFLLSDGGTPTIEIQNWQMPNSVTLLNKFSSAFKLQIDGPIRANVAATLSNGGYASKLIAGSLFVRDTASAMVQRISQLSTLATAGALSSIEIRNNLPTVSLTTSQLSTWNTFASLITTPYTLSQIISTGSLPSPTLSAGFANFTIKDSLANILANLPALNSLAKSGQLNAVQFTDNTPRISVSAATIQNYAEFWGVDSAGPWPFVLTDAGTPTITLTGGQAASYNLRDNVLDAIDGSYKVALTGNISASTGGSIVEESNSVLASLTGTFAVVDQSINIAQYYDQLEYLARQGFLTSVTLTDPGATINVTPGQAAADTALPALIQNSYVLGQTAACFAAGTRIRTLRGEVAVEALRVGDRVMRAAGGWRPVRWIGHRLVECARHPRAEEVWPVRVRGGAFGRGRPARTLWLSPDHAVFADGVLIPVRYLINGASIVQEARARVQYFHVELDAHDVLLAEGLPAESYLDTGNRAAFANGGSVVMAQPDFARGVWAARACAELVLDGPVLEAVRSLLHARAAAIGFAVSAEAELHLVADGERIAAAGGAEGVWRFALPAGVGGVRLVSRRHVPAEVDQASADRRVLGVAVAGLWLDGKALPMRGAGWQAAEADWCWTDGDAAIDCSGGRELVVRLAPLGRYWVRRAG